MRAVNLLPAERRKGADRERKKLTPVHGVGLAILVAGGALGYWGHGIRGQVNEQKNELADLEARATKLQADIVVAKAKVGAEQVSTYEVDRSLVVGLATSRVNWSAVMINLSRVAPSGVWLDSLAVTNPTADSATVTPGVPRTPSITLKAKATSRTNAALFLSRLSGIPGFDQPRLNGGIDPEVVDGATGTEPATEYVFTVDIPVDDGLIAGKTKTATASAAAPATTTPTQP